MFESLTSRFSGAFSSLRSKGKISTSDIESTCQEIRQALLESDVALSVVEDFIADIRQKSLAALPTLQSGTNQANAIFEIVNASLIEILGGQARRVRFAKNPPTVIMLAGLQGAGKTTTTGKLAKWLSEGNHVQYGRKTGKKKVAVVSADVYRPAAIEQLKTVAAQVGVEWIPSDPSQKPEDIARHAVDYARKQHFDVLIVDTAGRLGIDEAMMREIRALHDLIKPIETLFVVDAMQGQDAVNTAKAFGEALPLTGVVLTKIDGDARGGAALSVRHVTGKPLKFVGVSEKLDGLEAFHPERMAQRVLGMGDIVSLVEQAQKNIDMAEAEKLAAKIKSGDKFDLNDFRDQLMQVKKMGDMGSLLEKLPAQFAQAAGQLKDGQAEKQLRRTEGIINSMTPLERSKPELLKASRKRRIAAGAGVPVQEVNRMLNQFEQMQGMMKQMKKGGMAKMMRAMGGLKGLGKLGGFGR